MSTVKLPHRSSLRCLFSLVFSNGENPKLVELVVNRGVPAQQVLKIFLYIIPTFLELTVPMSFLLAILWGVGRFSVDRELIALRSCGLNFRQLADQSAT